MLSAMLLLACELRSGMGGSPKLGGYLYRKFFEAVSQLFGIYVEKFDGGYIAYSCREAVYFHRTPRVLFVSVLE